MSRWPAFLALVAALACSHGAPSIRLPKGWEVAIDAPVACPQGAECGWTRPRLAADCPAWIDLPRDEMMSWVPFRVGFAVQEDGGVSDIEMPHGVPASLDGALRRWLPTCRFEAARDPSGQPVRVHVSQAIRFVDPPWRDDPSRPSRRSDPLPCVAPETSRGAPEDVEWFDGKKKADGWTKPHVEPGCVQSRFRIPASYFPRGNLTVRFAVFATGEVGRFHVLTEDVPDDVACALWTAVRTCEWRPGSDPDGNPAAIWVILPVRFAP